MSADGPFGPRGPSGEELVRRIRAVLPATPADAGPRVAGPLRAASVLVPIYDEGEGARLLLVRRSDRLGKHAGQIALPGGGREPSEDELACALRETEEEIGVPAHAVDVLGPLDRHPTVTGYLVSSYVGFLPAWPLPLRPDPAEVAGILHVPVRRLLEPEALGTAELAPGHVVNFFSVGDDVIWGATARILRRLLELATGAPLRAEGSVPWDRVRW